MQVPAFSAHRHRHSDAQTSIFSISSPSPYAPPTIAYPTTATLPIHTHAQSTGIHHTVSIAARRSWLEFPRRCISVCFVVLTVVPATLILHFDGCFDMGTADPGHISAERLLKVNWPDILSRAKYIFPCSYIRHIRNLYKQRQDAISPSAPR
ncbi:uncharacterized protein LAESUDRAFT_563959 [Laetiporus sulphureus 93-53]|uniref:Uncharacterized protein n=1 Tax=Laetiporus sulphureus 93-53 TaxID=1314785 RepID=A0A165B4A1_9APHY|nr:uncharacterized protein LAESUDRAFT_563959 [Laetiporus sulphureus 93-53]KZT00199.1 hypothetical protein LAESUDRAFT_563959 [Laetiporus sulphureus 93-53]